MSAVAEMLPTLGTSTDPLLDKRFIHPRGLFVVVEGIDGAGKSSFCQKLSNRLSIYHGLNVHTTYEFSNGKIGLYIRNHLDDDSFTNKELQLLAMLDRLHHMTKLDGVMYNLHSEDKHDVVICDRGWMSTLAYALAEYDNDMNNERIKILFEISELISLTSIKPDLTIFIDTPVDTALERIASRDNHTDRFENRDTLEKVYRGYNQLIDYLSDDENPNELTQCFITVNGAQSQGCVVSDAVEKMVSLELIPPLLKGGI